MKNPGHRSIRVYVGTYTKSGSEGIYVYRLDPHSGALELESKCTGLQNPSYLALHPQGRHLYAVNEVADFTGKPTGAVSAFSIAPKTGQLTLLNHQPSQGTGPCHLSLDQTGRYVLVANYSGGSVAMLPVLADGRLGEACDVVQHEGHSINPDRQSGPHPHSITPGPNNRCAYVPDLGLDKIAIYELDLAQGKLKSGQVPWAQLPAGAGPRHLAFHPTAKTVYVINELDSTVTALAYDGADGSLRELQTLPALPAGYEGTTWAADIHVAPSGRFAYGSNRGHDSIAIFSVDPESGELSWAGYESTRGKWPRGFALDPSGECLLAANQDSDTIVSYHIDQGTGQLTATGHVAEVSMPVCLKMVSVP